MFVVAVGAALLAIALGETVGAQNPPAQGMRWTKAAPFPEPEEELYAAVISGVGGVTNAWEYDPVADSYKALPSLPGKRCAAQAEEVGGKIYVIGGLEPLKTALAHA